MLPDGPRAWIPERTRKLSGTFNTGSGKCQSSREYILCGTRPRPARSSLFGGRMEPPTIGHDAQYGHCGTMHGSGLCIPILPRPTAGGMDAVVECEHEITAVIQRQPQPCAGAVAGAQRAGVLGYNTLRERSS